MFQHRSKAAKHLKSHPFFKGFAEKPYTEAYIDEWCESLQFISKGSPVKRPKVNRRPRVVYNDDQNVMIFLKLSNVCC